MRVILLKNVARVGSKGDIVEVSEGYARNFLIKNGLAKEADKGAIKELNHKKESKEKQKKKELQKEFDFVKKYSSEAYKVFLHANEKGHLFEKLDLKKLLKLINDKEKLSFTEKELSLNEPIKELGSFDIHCTIDGKKLKFKLSVEATN